MASTSSWMPPPGRHAVNIGSSLGRAIKNRKLKGSPAPTTKRSNLPERDFYSFKFGFRASSVDASKPASIDIKKGAENTQIRAEYPSTQPGEVHTFNGTEQPAKDVDCILIYDEDTGQYTLEKLESYVQLKFDRKMNVSPRATSPAPSATSKGKAKQGDYEMPSAVEEDAEGEADVDDLEELLEQAIAEEPEEGEEIELPRRPVSPPKPQPAPPDPKARPVKPLPKTRTEPPAKVQPSIPAPAPVPVPAPPPKDKPAPRKKAKAQPPTSYPDEEVIEFGKPAKRARPSTPQQPPPPPPRVPSPVSLSLPGGSTPAFAPPPAPAIAKPTISRNIPAPAPTIPSQPSMPPSPQLVQSDSDDDEEDWEPVSTATPVIPQPQTDYEAALEEDIFGDDFADEADAGEDIDANDFEKMMNEQMERDSEDESSMVALSPEPDPQSMRKPISLKELASGGATVDSDDDDFSSSEESDED